MEPNNPLLDDFVLSLARIADKRPITVVDGGVKPAHALAAAEGR